MAPAVDEDELMRASERRDLVGPIFAVRQAAMEQDHGRALAVELVVNVRAFMRDGAVEVRRRHLGQGREGLPALLRGGGRGEQRGEDEREGEQG
jgi:hypothetical protein